jgi:hypothetical protein
MPVKFGPGVLKIGATGTEIDASCLVNGLTITSDVNSDDDVTKLCGTVVPGKRTYTFTMSGNLDTDQDAGATGLFALSQLSKGTEQDFTFTPNTDEGTVVAGTLIIDPMDFGADEYGTVMASDIEWALVGDPTYTWGTGVALTADEAAAAPPAADAA